MVNAKVELLKFLEEKPEVKCALVSFISVNPDTDIKEFTLKDNYLESDWEAFLTFLDFEYDDWHTVQQLFGIVWTKTPGWCDRAAYHGKEWWVYHKIPEIPDVCL